MSKFSNTLDQYIEQEDIWHFEGERGVRNLKNIITTIGYSGYGGVLENFLADNSGCIEAMIEWIKANDYSGEWNKLVAEELAPVKEDEDEEEDAE
jgi:hypothetical protein